MFKELNAACTKLLAEFEINAERMKDLIYPLSDRQVNWRPEYDKWSVLDNLLHINITNQSYLDNILGKLNVLRKAEKPFIQDAEWSILGRFFLYLMEPPYRLRFKAPKKLLPKNPLLREETVLQFMDIHNKIEAMLNQAVYYRLKGLRFYSPGSRHFSWSFVEIVSILAAHERRHLWQAEQIVSLPLFPQK